MASSFRDTDDGVSAVPAALIARAATAPALAHARLTTAIDDFFLGEDGRLDDRLRAGVARSLAAIVAVTEGAIAAHAARLLTTRDAPELALRLAQPAVSLLGRLAEAGVLRDVALMREVIARARQEQIGDALPAEAPLRADYPSLLTRLANHSDRVVAGAARALFVAENRRRAIRDGGMASDLPAELHHRLVWWITAALRQRLDDVDDAALRDAALTDAASRVLAAHDEGEALEAAAMRLARVVAPSRGQLVDMLIEALGDRRLVMFTALLADSVAMDYDLVRDFVADPAGNQLLLALRALDLDRGTIARIGLALCEADPRRNLDAFAATLDDAMALQPDAAQAGLAALKMHPDLRAALLALGEAT
ncbi:DUF2336 domain-containing protein [Sphingomonas qilianensis]|uniref:DUF2336 domain-containing protein n=1 Tax=Sphingomonas qilianensis TaxID=1736690 RepID=A0ABU9XS33_9SPHN